MFLWRASDPREAHGVVGSIIFQFRAENILAEHAFAKVKFDNAKWIRQASWTQILDDRQALWHTQTHVVPPDGADDVVLRLLAGVVERVAIDAAGTKGQAQRLDRRAGTEDLADLPPAVGADRVRGLVDEVETVQALAVFRVGVDLQHAELVGLHHGGDLD